MSESDNKPAVPAQADHNNESPQKEPVILATKVCGIVKWFSVKSGYGFISTPSSNEDVFVHSKRIKYNNPRKLLKTLAEGETVEFDIMQGDKGHEAINVTGPDGRYVQGSQFAANKPRYGERRSRDSRGKAPAKRKRRNRKNNRRGRKSSGSPSESKTEGDKKETKDTKAEETNDSEPNTEVTSEEKKS